MKKILSLVLAVLMLTALTGVPAFAEETMPVALNETGVTLNIPYSYLNTSGYVSVSDGSELAPGLDMYCTEVNYLAMPYDAVEELDPNSEEDMQRYFNSMASLFVIFSLGPGKTVGDLCSYLDSAYGQEGVVDTSRLTQIAEVDGYTFYLYQDPLYQDTSGFPDPEYEAEYEELLSRTDEILELSDFSRPRDHFENMTGSGLDFVTTDLDGNMISSKDLFAQHEVTLLNVWASWCGPCQDELPELEAINNRIAADDCAVVGLLYDGDEDEAVEAARQVLQASGVTYLVIRPPENVDEIFDIQCYPTTFYISRDGKFLGECQIGFGDVGVMWMNTGTGWISTFPARTAVRVSTEPARQASRQATAPRRTLCPTMPVPIACLSQMKKAIPSRVRQCSSARTASA